MDPSLGPGVVRSTRSCDVPLDLTGIFEDRRRILAEGLKDSLSAGMEKVGMGLGVGDEGIGIGKGMGVVEIQAGGWSFTARDMDGGVWVWGGSFFVYFVDLACGAGMPDLEGGEGMSR